MGAMLTMLMITLMPLLMLMITLMQLLVLQQDTQPANIKAVNVHHSSSAQTHHLLVRPTLALDRGSPANKPSSLQRLVTTSPVTPA